MSCVILQAGVFKLRVPEYLLSGINIENKLPTLLSFAGFPWLPCSAGSTTPSSS